MFSKLFNNALLKASLIYSVINFINKVFPFILLPIFTREFSLEEFGTYNLIKALIGILIPIVGFNVSESIIRNYFKLEKESFSNFISSGLLIIIFLCLLSVSILYFIPESLLVEFFDLRTNYILVAILISFFTATNNIERGLLRCTNNTKLFAILVLFQTISYFIICLILFYIGKLSLINVIVTDLIIFSIFGFISLFLLKAKFSLEYKFNYHNFKSILSYSTPLVLNSLLAYLFALSDRFIISSSLGNSSVAIYSATFQIVSIIQILAVSFNAAWVPYIYKLLKSDLFNLRSYYIRRNIIMITFAVISLIYYFALKTFLIAILGDKYIDGQSLIIWMVLSNLLQAFYWVSSPVLQFYNKNWLLICASLPAFIISITLNGLLLREKGVIFAAQVNTFSWLIIFSITYFNSIKLIRSNVKQDLC